MKKIILHIPKTAGTTIRMILEDDEKVKLLSVYPGEKHYTQLSDLKKMDLKLPYLKIFLVNIPNHISICFIKYSSHC